MNSATKEIYTVGKVTAILNLPPTCCTDTSTSKNASNIIIKSCCESDVCLDGYDKEILSILEDLQCPPNPVKSQSQINLPSVQKEQCMLSGSFA